MVYKDLLERPPEGHFHIKMTGVLIKNFEKNPLRGIKILFCGRGLSFSSLLRGTKRSFSKMVAENSDKLKLAKIKNVYQH